MHGPAFENAIGNLLKLAGVVLDFQRSAPFDFLFQDEQGRSHLVEVKHRVDAVTLHGLAYQLNYHKHWVDRFFLVTPTPPTISEEELFHRYFPGKPRAAWLSGRHLALHLGLGRYVPSDPISPEVMDELEARVVSGQLTKQADAAPASETQCGERSDVAGGTMPREQALQFYGLGRQLAPSVLARLRDDESLEDRLQLGGIASGVVVLLSDIRNFTDLLKSSQMSEMQELMSNYYRHSREIVWRHGGVLVQFIGDAVFAVFNYPYPQVAKWASTLRCAARLILLGRRILGNHAARLDHSVEIATRVGITVGDLWILDIGKASIELSFGGYELNLAARLQHECTPDGILIGNRGYSLASRSEGGLLDGLDLQRRCLPREHVKGAPHDVMAWQIAPEKVLYLLGCEDGKD